MSFLILQVKLYSVKKSGTFLVLETGSIQMDQDPIELLVLGIGKPPEPTKLSPPMVGKSVSRKLWFFTLEKRPKALKLIGLCTSIDSLKIPANMVAPR